jgi:hypothetical protein
LPPSRTQIDPAPHHSMRAKPTKRAHAAERLERHVHVGGRVAKMASVREREREGGTEASTHLLPECCETTLPVSGQKTLHSWSPYPARYRPCGSSTHHFHALLSSTTCDPPSPPATAASPSSLSSSESTTAPLRPRAADAETTRRCKRPVLPRGALPPPLLPPPLTAPPLLSAAPAPSSPALLWESQKRTPGADERNTMPRTAARTSIVRSSTASL